MKIRASIGTAAALGMETIRIQALPTTAYLLMYTESPCQSNCSFCPQARDSTGRGDSLSRVLWPSYDLWEIIKRLKENPKGIKRICIQTIRYENSDADLLTILSILTKSKTNIPLTVCCYPVEKKFFVKMKEFGVTRVGISFDCATQDIFDAVKGRKRKTDLSWELLEKSITDACEVFGNRFVSTHLIIGLEENEEEAVQFIQKFYNRKITVGLFAFTPVKGTDLEDLKQPKMDSYRRVQVARYLIALNKASFDLMSFKNGKIIDFGIKQEELSEIITSGEPFRTSGCPSCNRPFYNESPGRELFNFPYKPKEEEIEQIRKYLDGFL